MPSSISSFESDRPNMPWRKIHGFALLAFAACVGLMEWRLAQLGYQPTVLDSTARWNHERTRASHLGERAIILVGASRIQLGVDLDILRQETGLEPVQLAIDGTPADPVLADLAADPAIRGTILVDYYGHGVDAVENRAGYYLKKHSSPSAQGSDLSPAAWAENLLAESLRERMRSYADGAQPIMSLLVRIGGGQAGGAFLTTRPDRSRFADYSQVKMPEYYYKRVARELGLDSIGISSNTQALLERQIQQITASESRRFLERVVDIRRMAQAIQARGGRVVFIQMPTSGMIREIEEKRYPDKLFWERCGLTGILCSPVSPARTVRIWMRSIGQDSLTHWPGGLI